MLELIISIKGATITPAAATTVKLAQVLPYINHNEAVRLIADHERITMAKADVEYSLGTNQLQAAGL